MDSMSQSENYSKIGPMTQEERQRAKVREETNRFSFGMQIDGGMLYDAAKLYFMVKGHIPDFLRKSFKEPDGFYVPVRKLLEDQTNDAGRTPACESA